MWAVHGVLSEVTTGDIEVDGSHSIALDWTLARWQPWTIPFPLLLLPQKYYLKPWEILSQMSQTHNIIIIMLIYSDTFDNMLILQVKTTRWP